MNNDQKFKNFGSVMESEMLDPQQMNSLEAGTSCMTGCKKACLNGGQNSVKRINVDGTMYDPDAFEHADAKTC